MGAFHAELPQTLQLKGGQLLHCERLLRMLPGKRAVFKARLQNQPVLAKIFLETAQRQVARERAGYDRLVAAGQPTPKRIDTLNCDGGTVILFEFLDEVTPLFREDILPSKLELDRLLDRLQAMYAAGVYQEDLHWGNFLWHRGIAFVIDTGAVLGEPPRALTPSQVTDNLGLLIAQFHRCDQDFIRDSVLEHSLSRQFLLTADKLDEVSEKHWRQRKQALLKKCFRETSAARFQRTCDRICAYRRAYAGPGLDTFLRDPDSAMAQASILKLGNSATVAKLKMDGRSLVVKRYNIKGALHWLRRCWRPSRAWTSWRNAHWLELLGLHTPAPVAFIEMRCGPLRRHAYYLCEFVEGETLADIANVREPNSKEIAELEKYFAVAAREHLIHGDMKATNFLVQNSVLTLLDLDAMRTIQRGSRWRKLFRRDFARFERNFATRDAAWLNSLRSFAMRLAERYS